MANPKRKPDLPLYERDFFAWTQEQAEKLRARAHNEVDWENVAEEIDSVGRSQKNEIRSRMGVLMKHLLKWQFQPNRRSESWLSTISEQRTHLRGLLEMSPSLSRLPSDVLPREYQWARRDAARETRLPMENFPAEPVYAAEQVLNEEFFPGEPWVPGEILRD